MSWLPVLMTPLSFASRLTISSLSYLLSSLLFIASPVIYLGQVVLYLTLLPLRILIRLEVCSDIKTQTNRDRSRCNVTLQVSRLLTSPRHSSISWLVLCWPEPLWAWFSISPAAPSHRLCILNGLMRFRDAVQDGSLYNQHQRIHPSTTWKQRRIPKISRGRQSWKKKRVAMNRNNLSISMLNPVHLWHLNCHCLTDICILPNWVTFATQPIISDPELVDHI